MNWVDLIIILILLSFVFDAKLQNVARIHSEDMFVRGIWKDVYSGVFKLRYEP